MTAILLLAVVGLAAGEPTGWSLALRDRPLAEIIETLAELDGARVELAPGLRLEGRTTLVLDGVEPRKALESLLRGSGLLFERDGDVYRIRPGERPEPEHRPAPPAPRPAPPDVASSPVRDRGTPMLGAKRYELIPIRYAYAPGLAVALGGRALLYSDIDPWARSFGGGLGGGSGGGFGGGSGGRLGGGLQGGGQSVGDAVFELPDGIEELVGVDWISGMIAR